MRYKALSEYHQYLVDNAVKIIKNDGDCQDTDCTECFLSNEFCSMLNEKTENLCRKNVLIICLVQLIGEQETKDLLTEELI